MSENHLRLIPTDPYFVPEPAAIEQAHRLFAACLPASYETTACVFDTVQFVDPGGNMGKILCPYCQSELAREWWQQSMDTSFAGDFLKLGVTTPCCDYRTTLNDLHYTWPVGFTRFRLEARDSERDLTDEQLRELERILGTPLRKIWAHY